MNAPVNESPQAAARRLASKAIADGFEPEALHTYADTDGNEIYYRLRARRPNGEKWIRPMRRNGCGYELGEPAFENGKPLYRLEQSWSWKSVPVYVVEGEKAADALDSIGITATTSGSADSAEAADWSPLAGGSAIIWPDNDEPGRKYAEAVTRILIAQGTKVRWVDIATMDLPPKGDGADWVAANPSATPEDVEALPLIDPPTCKPKAPVVNLASVRAETAADAAERLAGLHPLEYEKVRQKEADQLGVRVSVLDAEIAKLRRGSADSTGQGYSPLFDDPDPYPEAVDGASVADAVAATFRRYLMLPAHADIAMTLWVFHTHCYDAFTHTPRLNIRAPEKGCGKSTGLDVLNPLCPRTLQTENVTTAVVFRLTDRDRPTLLIDECDTFLKTNEELRGALNAGHKRGGVFMRCEGDANEVRAFSVFAPVALAGMHELPGTLHDRSIVIEMKRARPGEVAAKWDSRRTAPERDLFRKVARWCADNIDALRAADPDMGELFNRVADNWRPLFAIADQLGEHWPAKAREAAAALSARRDTDGESIKVQLLEDIRQVFAEKGVDRISSEDLTSALVAIEDRPWAEFSNGKALTKNRLARLLRPFRIAPGTKRSGATTFKGYVLPDFEDVFTRYICTIKPSHRHNVDVARVPADFENVTPDQCDGLQITLKANNGAGCDVVTVANAGSQPQGGIDDGVDPKVEEF